MGSLQGLIERANRALGRLDGIFSVLPDTAIFLYMYVRKEALLSSQIEGTQSSFSDLLLFEVDETRVTALDDVREVSNYVKAMEHGLYRIRDGFPLSMRLLREIHGILLERGRDSNQTPGEFRRSQNWVGSTRPGNAVFVPPPPDRIQECLSDLEKFLHRETPEIPSLVKAGLAHVQFETIHPFLDGNGRLGRLLITFLLCLTGALKEPTLYLSLYFKSHRQQYYDLLQQVREHGDWEVWLTFFLTGVEETSTQATEMAIRILKLFEEDREKIRSLGRSSPSALNLHHCLQTRLLISVGTAAERMGVSKPTARKSVQHLQELGILKEISGKQRDRWYLYSAYYSILEQGTEPLEI